jgi:hypothetical protein
MPINFSDSELQQAVWLGSGGALLVLLQSILSGERRVWWRLLLSCIIGGGAAVLAGSIFHDSRYVYAICGVAAIISENIIFGLFKASNEFKNNPIAVFADIWRLVMPTFGRGTDKPSGLGSPSRDDHSAAG